MMKAPIYMASFMPEKKALFAPSFHFLNLSNFHL